MRIIDSLKHSPSLLIVVFLSFFTNCSSQKNLSEIKFGEGGGFTGGITEYQIKPNGEVFINKSFENEQKKLKAIRKSAIKQIQKKIDHLSNETLKFNHPFNIYYFIEAKKGNEKIRIVWGDPQYPEPTEIKELYNELQKLITP